MDVAAVEAELEQLKREKAETKQRLDAQRGPFGAPGAFKNDRLQGGPDQFRRGPPIPAPPFASSVGPPPREDTGRDGYGYGRGRGNRLDREGGMGGRGGLMRRGPAGDPRDIMPPELAGNHSMHAGGPHQGGPPRRGRPPSDHDDRDRGPRFNSSGPLRGGSGRGEAPFEVPPAVPRRKLVSSVVVKDGGEPRASEEPKEPGSARGTKRSAPEGDDIVAEGEVKSTGQGAGVNGDGAAAGGPRKRSRGMFGSLLGTLAKFREEDATFQASDVATRRLEAQRKAEERERQQSQALRRREYEARQEKREEELTKLAEISLATDTKHLELIFLKRIARRQALSCFIATKAQPPLYWMPAMPSPTTDALLQEQKEKFEEWKAATLVELDVEKEALRKRSEERRAGALARRAARLEAIAARRAEAGAAVGVTKGEEEAEDADIADQRALEVGEYGGHEEAKPQQQDEGIEPMDEAEPQAQGPARDTDQRQQPQPRTQPAQRTKSSSVHFRMGADAVEEGERVTCKKGGNRRRPAGQDGKDVDVDDRYQGGHEHGEEEEEGERRVVADESEQKTEKTKEVGKRRSGRSGHAAEADSEAADDEEGLEHVEGLRDREAATVEDLLS